MKFIITLIAAVTLLSGCGGGGAGGSESPAPATQPSGPESVGGSPGGVPIATSVTITGKVTFDNVPVAVTGDASRLDYASTVRLPARSIAVALIDSSSGAELATAKSDANGDYSLTGPVGKSVFVRAYAKLLPVNASTTEVVSVLDNTNADAQWAIDGAAFLPVDATALTKNLNASSGWTGTAYNDSQRVAGTFAILDTIYTGMQKIVAVDSSARFQKLSVHWSPNNIAAPGTEALGQIRTSFFRVTSSAGGVSRDLYILGRANNDTDEYDRHVVAHEFGHYLQSVFSRDDSIGGSHGGPNDRLDMRVAFSEGWGNAWSGYSLGNKFYADTNGASQASGFSLDISAGETINPGWFKEASVQKIIWDLSTGSIGFGPVWTAMKTGLTASPALTSAHAFANALRNNLPSSLTTLNAVFNNQSIVVPSDAYGTGETNFSSPAITELSPIYTPYGAPGSISNVCVTNAADAGGSGNKSGEHRYLKLTGLTPGAHTFTVARDSSTAGSAITTEPDFRLYNVTGAFVISESTTANTESTTVTLSGGNYVLALTDYAFQTSPTPRRACFNVTVN